jgi:Ser/Thr protein kinase RdoA (MazF antagonist)
LATRDDFPVSALAEAYDLGPWESIDMLPVGESDHYRLIAGSGEYAIRRSHRSKTSTDMRFEHELVAHLRDSGFPAPVVVPTVSGDTCAAVDGDLYSVSVFVDGSGFEAGNAEHLRESARALAEYHRISASFRPLSSRFQEPFLKEILRERLTEMPPPEAISDFADAYADHDPQIPDVLVSLYYTLEKSEDVLGLLDWLYPGLPLLTIHGGCWRSSALFSGDRLITMLGFDSARYEARVLDLAIALHTFAKVFGEHGSPDFKVPLDLEIVSGFLGAYLQANPLEPAEVEALPALLAARPLKRAIGKYRSMIEAELVSQGHVRKTAQEVARVRWLEAHGKELRTALWGTPQTAS